jgi:hypothetical protein
VAPVLSTATVNGTSLVLTYTEVGGGLSTVTPDIADFTVTKGTGNTVVNVNSVLVNKTLKTITLGLDTAILASDTSIKVNYTATTNKLQDVAGNLSLNLTNQSVTNQTAAMQAPTLTAAGTSPTFNAGDAATLLFSGAAASTIESGQTLTRLDLTVTNVTDGANEELTIDGTTINLGAPSSGSTIHGSYVLTYSSGTATISLSGLSLSTSNIETLVNAIQYRNTGFDPTLTNRVVTLTRIDDSGVHSAPDANSSALMLQSIISVMNPNKVVNQAPTLSTNAIDPTFTIGQSVVSLFSGTSISTVEAGQTIESITLTVSGALNINNEFIVIDGSSISISNPSSGMTDTNSLPYAVSYNAGVATIILSGMSIAPSSAQSLIDSMIYKNMDTVLTKGTRIVTLIQIKDSGGTLYGGTDTSSLINNTKISLIVNDKENEQELLASRTKNRNEELVLRQLKPYKEQEEIENIEQEVNKEGLFRDGEIATKNYFVKNSLSNAAFQKSLSFKISAIKSSEIQNRTEKNKVENKPQLKIDSDLPLRNVLTPPDAILDTKGHLSYELPKSTFAGGKGAITLTATQKDGTALPSWIKFDGATGKAIADIPKGLTSVIEIKVQARDSQGNKAETIFKIKPRTEKISFVGKKTLSAQFKNAYRMHA